jgi:tetratricopeptide (TPR) repeat protein
MHKEAIADYNRAIELMPGNQFPRSKRGLAHEKLGQWNEAIADYTQALKLQENWPFLLNQRGNAFYSLRQWDKAVADYSKALGQTPKDAVVLTNRANAYAEWGRWKESAADSQGAMSISPKDTRARISLALLCLRAGDLAGYQKACAGLVEHSAKNAEPAGVASLVWTCCVAPDAVMDYTPLVSLAEKAAAKGKTYTTRRALGAILYRAGKFDAAIKRLQEATALQEQAPTAWLFLAMAHHRAGHADEAGTWLKKAELWIDQASKEGTKKVIGSKLMVWQQLPWTERLALERLRQEAAVLLAMRDKSGN